MLVLSKTEKTEVDLSKVEEINPSLVVDEVIEEFRLLKPNVRYIINIEEDIKIRIDPNHLKQLLIIFIDNSIKYNNKESIEIKITLTKRDKEVKLEVEDNGIGIPSY